jgi:hypothetical protein
MLAELIVDFKKVTAAPPEEAGVCMSAMSIWGFSVAEVLKLVAVKAIELGRKYREDIEQAAKVAVDRVVEMDIPYLPEEVEGTVDETTRALGYAAVEAVLNAILAE